ncbi:hypothetical protein CERSUDRAFT_106731 [Gelatoporia subvermispora B]|uniref:CFA20 domain-containing protein n=1 Tax=Ceriporiopsis subvermispora (strain B) TaxID=914234 RepID=M2RA54_CERS8|nr:hypothetical protein CERSUDRAFT_106731 [Gelatoporia subvermispora B]
MLISSVQSGVVSLFSSTGSDPLELFSARTDARLPEDSLICLLNDETSEPFPPPPATLIPVSHRDNSTTGNDGQDPEYTLAQTVLHIQSPTLRATYICCPPSQRSHTRNQRRDDLGVLHPWIHLQVRDMDREWSFEVGIVDRFGREGVIRCSTFQKEPRLKLCIPPLLHLPLAFPSTSSHRLTAWSTITLHLSSLLPHFSSAALMHGESADDADEEASYPRREEHHTTPVPSGTYSHVSYVKVYATCRLRRIWFSEGGPSQKLPWEFQLYAAQ